MLELNDLVDLTNDELLPAFRTERKRLDRIDRWMRWDHDKPHTPKRNASREYRELIARAQAPWGDLIVGSVAQTLYVEGYRRPDEPTDSLGWEIWQANGMDARQVALHRAALGYGLAYGLALPGTTLAGEPMPKMRGISPRQMIALYEDPSIDEWPAYALWMRKVRKGWKLSVLDEDTMYSVRLPADADHVGARGWTEELHGSGVCPVVRYANRFDLEGRSTGEIEPFIPLLGRIDQTVFDRLVVQRFGAWVVRYATGMDLAASAELRGESVDATKQRLGVEDMLVAHDSDAKFGTLDATSLDGYIKAEGADKVDLSAVSQTPSFEMLGMIANLSAEALAAAKSSQTAKSDERKVTFGEAHEQFMRLGAWLAGDPDGAGDFMAQVRWADTSIRSLAQAVDAYGKLATMLGFPAELLWGKVPGMTDQDVDEARDLVEERGGADEWFAQLRNSITPAPTT